jgi:hypothetical protein
MSRPSLLRARSTQLFAQLLSCKRLTWSIHMLRKYRRVSVFKLSGCIDGTDRLCSRRVLYNRVPSTVSFIRVEK